MWTPFVTIEALARSRGEKRDKKKRMISSSFLFSVSAVEKLIYLKCIIHIYTEGTFLLFQFYNPLVREQHIMHVHR